MVCSKSRYFLFLTKILPALMQRDYGFVGFLLLLIHDLADLAAVSNKNKAITSLVVRGRYTS